MDILKQLGLNLTFFIQVGIFLATYFLATRLIFRPFYQAMAKREELTVGSKESAESLKTEIGELEQKYQVKAREVATKVHSTFEAARSEAGKEHAKRVLDARKDGEAKLTQARTDVAKTKQELRNELQNSISGLSQAVAAKMMSKDV